jgi:predicted transcriptional regulator
MRQRVLTRLVAVRLPEDLYRSVDTLAGRQHRSRSSVVREALAQHLRDCERRRAVA